MANLTISQALRQIKKLKGQLSDNLARASSSVSYVVDNKPAFSFKATLEKSDEIRNQLIKLESMVYITNANTTFDFEGKNTNLAEAVRTLQELKGQIVWVKGLPCRAHVDTKDDSWDYNDDGKRIRTTTHYKCDLPEAERSAFVEKLQDQFDRLNNSVEKMNHITVLL